MNIQEIIDNSIESVISEAAKEAEEQVIDDLNDKILSSDAGKYLQKIKAMEDETGVSGRLHSAVHKLKRNFTNDEAREEMKNKITSVGSKAMDAIKEHPGISAAVVASLAAGVGALALRKKLKNASK